MEKQNNETSTTQEVVSYEKDKIQLLFNILNSMSFTKRCAKANSFRCGMDSTNNVYVGIENIHIL